MSMKRQQTTCRCPRLNFPHREVETCREHDAAQDVETDEQHCETERALWYAAEARAANREARR